MNFNPLTSYLDSISRDIVPGYNCIIYNNDKLVYSHSGGFSDYECKTPIKDDDIYFIFSATKLITCTCALQLIEKNLMSLDDPVGKYLPAFNNLSVIDNGVIRPAKATMKIWHLLSMQAGLNYNIQTEPICKIIKEKGDLTSTQDIVNALAESPLEFEPGTHFNYSLCHDVLAAVIEKVSDMTLGKYMEENVFKPLNMNNTGFHETDNEKDRFVAQYVFGNKELKCVPTSLGNWLRPTKLYESGGAGLFSSASDYAKFQNALCNYRIIKKETVDMMKENRLTGDSLNDFHKIKSSCYGYGLGVRTMINPDATNAASPVGEFGWDGAAGAYVLIDTENKLTVFYGQYVLDHSYVFENVHPKIRDIIYKEIL